MRVFWLRMAEKSRSSGGGRAATAPRGCNGAAAGLQRAPRCTPTSTPLRPRGALTAAKKQRFWPEKAAFRLQKVAQFASFPIKNLAVSRLHLHALFCDI